MTTTPVWNVQRFPMIYDGGKPAAVIIDLASFKQIQLVMDNLMNREPEPEDDIIARSATLYEVAQRVMATAEPLSEWEKTLDEL